MTLLLPLPGGPRHAINRPCGRNQVRKRVSSSRNHTGGGTILRRRNALCSGRKQACTASQLPEAAARRMTPPSRSARQKRPTCFSTPCGSSLHCALSSSPSLSVMAPASIQRNRWQTNSFAGATAAKPNARTRSRSNSSAREYDVPAAHVVGAHFDGQELRTLFATRAAEPIDVDALGRLAVIDELEVIARSRRSAARPASARIAARGTTSSMQS